jgi:hypothetical protein
MFLHLHVKCPVFCPAKGIEISIEMQVSRAFISTAHTISYAVKLAVSVRCNAQIPGFFPGRQRYLIALPVSRIV